MSRSHRRSRSQTAVQDSEESPVPLQPGDHSQADRTSSGRRWRWGYLALVCGGLVLVGAVFGDWWSTVTVDGSPGFVGRQTCVQCHQAEAHKWEGSHHDLAMDLATKETVLGNFNDIEITHHDVTSTLYRHDDKYMVRTEGPAGEMADFEIKYVFGVEPLQQYMVEFDRPADMPKDAIARLQVLRISWDTRKKEWFYLPPPDVEEKLDPEDDLHWTGIAQRWNNMCADCHSTNLQKNFDTQTKTYHTTFSEMDVSCEACHGPGSVHVELARSRSLFWDRKLGYGLTRLKGDDPDREIRTCAKCHARRRVLNSHQWVAGEDYYQGYATELLSPTTYHADGQILDEVYVHGSFIQSKMYQKGVRCTDCHDPHTARLKHNGNQVCTSCHQHSAGKYDSPAHHHHEPGSTGAQCVNCHMPATTYMEVDARRDHSLRVPRPDLSVTLHTPNACTGCHLEPEKIGPEKRARLKQYKDWILAAWPITGEEPDSEIRAELERLNGWAAEYMEKWYPRTATERRAEHFANALHAAWNREPDAEQRLLKMVRRGNTPAIARATGLVELGTFPSDEALATARAALEDPSPLVRAAAVAAFETQLPTQTELGPLREEQAAAVADQLSPLVEPLLPLLDDSQRYVRIEAARVLTRVPPGLMRHLTGGPQRRQYQSAFQELETSLMVNNDRGGSFAVLGSLYEQQGDDEQAERAYRKAIDIEPTVVGPRTNLAALLDRRAEQAMQAAQRSAQQGYQEVVRKMLAQAQGAAEEAARLRTEELPLVQRDAKLAPHNAAIQYRYGLSLYLNDRAEEAEQALLRAYQLEPTNSQFVLMLALFYQKFERFGEALRYAEELVELTGENPSHQQLLTTVRQQAERQQDERQQDESSPGAAP